MRLITTIFTVALAMLFSVSAANAYRVDMLAFLSDDQGATGAAYNDENLQVGDFIKIIVDFDDEGSADIAILGFGEVFDDSSFTYRRDLSSTTSYFLYDPNNSKNDYLIANSTCGGYGGPTAGEGCLRFGFGTGGFIPDQVGISFLSTGLPAGSPNLMLAPTEVVQLVFEVTDVSAGAADFSFDFDLDRGGILQLGDGSRVPLGLGGDVTVNLPEPSTVLLSIAALTTVVAIRRRRHA